VRVSIVLAAVLRGAVRRLVRALTALETDCTMLGGAFVACVSFYLAPEPWAAVGLASRVALFLLGITHLRAWVLRGRVS